jgi:hypothetical protein
MCLFPYNSYENSSWFLMKHGMNIMPLEVQMGATLALLDIRS